jgi:Alkaline phosphatase PhoX
MSTSLVRRPAFVAAAVTAVAAAVPASAEQPGIEDPIGPSTSTPPYVVPVAPGVRTSSLLTVGDSVEGYRMVGIPDGLGAYRNNGNRLTLLMNHELNDTQGIAPRHGLRGAFVSEWSVDRKSFAVTAARDLIDPGVQYWDYGAGAYSSMASGPFDRFCSNTLTEPGQLYNEETGNGYPGQLFFPNEEGGVEGRAFALTTDGMMAQLPRRGLFSAENTLPAHNRTDTTLVVGTEDDAAGQLWVYAGRKQADGSPFDRAGLTNGTPSVAAVAGVTTDAGFRTAYPKGTPARFTLREVDWNQTGIPQNAEAAAKGLSLNRLEDGHWDPAHPNDLYFLTTEGGTGADDPTGRFGRDGGGLWRLTFDDIERPELGGTLTLLLDGSEAPFLNKPDNMAIDDEGNLLIQEDPGNNVAVSRIVAYRIADGARGVLAQFDPALFGWRGARLPNGNPVLEPGQLTFDEESSGIIDAHHVIGPRWFLFDAQVHRALPDPELVQGGQLLALHVDRWNDLYTIAP